MQQLDTPHILHDAQHGFRKHRSTETLLIQLIDNLAHNIDNRIQTDAIILDSQKAFDKVPHQSLLYKLTYYGISPQSLNWIHSFLSDRTQQVLLEGNTSSSINVTSGVPQGSVLGPILFLIYINDLPDYIKNNSTVNLFAGDTIIYLPITNPQDDTALQEDIDALQRWESDWRMHFHPQKCQTMHITNKRNIIQSTYTIHNHKLETTDTAKYLGRSNCNSELTPLHVGEPEGSILGPRLFIIYFNDITVSSNIFKFTMYTDDNTLSTTIDSTNENNCSTELINNELSKSHDWLLVNKLS